MAQRYILSGNQLLLWQVHQYCSPAVHTYSGHTANRGRMKSLEVVAVSWYPFGFPKVVYTPSFCRTGRLFSLTSYFLTTRFVAKGLHIHRAYHILDRRTRNRCIQGIGKQIYELIRSWESSGVRFNLKGSTRRQGEEKNNGVVSIFTETMLGSTMTRR